LDQARAAPEVRLDSRKREFMATHGNKEAVVPGPGGRYGPHYLQPTDEPTALLAGAMPPAAPRSHEHKWLKVLVAPRDLGGDVEGLHYLPVQLCYEGYLCAFLLLFIE